MAPPSSSVSPSRPLYARPLHSSTDPLPYRPSLLQTDHVPVASARRQLFPHPQVCEVIVPDSFSTLNLRQVTFISSVPTIRITVPSFDISFSSSPLASRFYTPAIYSSNGSLHLDRFS